MPRIDVTRLNAQIIIASFVLGLVIAGIMSHTEIEPVGYITYYEAHVEFHYDNWEVPRNFETFYESCMRLFEGGEWGYYICEQYEYEWQPYSRFITDQYYRPGIEKTFETNYEYVKTEWMYSEIELKFSFYSQYIYFHEKTPYNPLSRGTCFQVRREGEGGFSYKEIDCWEMYYCMMRYMEPIPKEEPEDWIINIGKKKSFWFEQHGEA